MSDKNKNPIPEAIINEIQSMAGNIKYGTLTLIFQDGKLIQIDKSEKLRLEKRQ